MDVERKLRDKRGEEKSKKKLEKMRRLSLAKPEEHMNPLTWIR
jgi:hypothetical protein